MYKMPFLFAIVQNDDLGIVYAYDAPTTSPLSFGDTFLGDTNLTHVLVPNGLNKYAIKAARDTDGSIIIIKDESKHDVVVELQWNNVRDDRNKKLAATDWTQLADVTLTTEQRTAWTTYRQQLRDVPINNEDPFNITWPIPPS
jgi:hypothetical protein